MTNLTVTLASSTAALAALLLRSLASDKSGKVAQTTAWKAIDLTALADQVEYGEQATPALKPPAGGWRSDLVICSKHFAFLAEHEREFISTMSLRREPDERQRDKLRELAIRLRGGDR